MDNNSCLTFSYHACDKLIGIFRRARARQLLDIGRFYWQHVNFNVISGSHSCAWEYSFQWLQKISFCETFCLFTVFVVWLKKKIKSKKRFRWKYAEIFSLALVVWRCKCLGIKIRPVLIKKNDNTIFFGCSKWFFCWRPDVLQKLWWTDSLKKLFSPKLISRSPASDSLTYSLVGENSHYQTMPKMLSLSCEITISL